MSENTKKTQITINEVSYTYEDLTEEQQFFFNNCIDLDRKIGSAQFNLNQLLVGKDAFLKKLEESLSVEKAEVEVV